VRINSETGEYMDDDEVNIYLQDDLVMECPIIMNDGIGETVRGTWTITRVLGPENSPNFYVRVAPFNESEHI
jgi:hypothetical protein